MNRVALYPFNKITQGLIRFRDLLDFRIATVVDFVFHPGEDAGQRVDGRIANIPICPTANEGLNGVDTLILNDPGTSFGGNRRLFDDFDLAAMWRQLILTATLKGIKVVSVHEIYDEETIEWMNGNGVTIEVVHNFDPQIMNELESKYETNGSRIERYLKHFHHEHSMLHPEKTIKRIGIFATRGCIGKFTAQLSLYREFKNSGANVTAFITEPTGCLFHLPEGDIFKFLARQPFDKYPYYIDSVVGQAEKNGYEWILMAGQSSILPTSNIMFNSLRFAMLKAFNPHCSLLIVGYKDDEQIRDALDILRIYSSPPAALLLPDKIETSYGDYETISHEARIQRKRELQERFGVPVEWIENSSAIKELLVEAASQIAY